MRPSVALKLLLSPKTAGFNLLELTVVVIITAIAAALGVGSLTGAYRQSKMNEAFTLLTNTIIEAQANANRKSETCTITITENTDEYTVSGSPAGCVFETLTIDKDILSLTSSAGSAPWTVAFTFTGTTTNTQTFLISPRDGSGNAQDEVGKCIVIANGLGMIRTGIYAPDDSVSADANNFPDCLNVDNKKYDNQP